MSEQIYDWAALLSEAGITPPSNPTSLRQALAAIASAAGGGGDWGQSSTAKYSGSGSPVGVVTPSGEGDLYVDDTTPGLWQATGATSADWQQVGTSVQGMPIANPTGPPTEGTETPDPISGSDTANWVQFPADATVMAWGLQGDAHPRVVFGADPTDDGFVMLGDGTIDPVSGGPAISLGPSLELVLGSAGDIRISTTSGLTLSAGSLSVSAPTTQNDDETFSGNTIGPVLVDQSDGHTYRIISTAGVLSTVQVT